MITTKEKVTPTKAAEWLEKEIENNRNTNPHRVESYARQMLKGLWMSETGETIKFNKAGMLIDGKHRLKAVIRSGVSIWFHVNYEIENDVINVIDSGFARNAGNVLAINKVPNFNNIGKLVRVYKTLIDLEGTYQKGATSYTPIEVLNEYVTDEEFFQYAYKLASRYYESFSKIIPPSFIGGFYAYCSKYSARKEKLNQFMDEFFNVTSACCRTIGTGRKKLLDDRLSPVKKLSGPHRYNTIIKAYNNYTAGNLQMTRIPLDTFEPIK